MLQKLYIQRCLELAKKGIGTTRPNPSVGAVIVVENKIIGEGFTSPFGGNHAEVNAINSVKDKTLLSNATLYVTLEPCSHYGKTPPCANLIIENKIKKVVVGCLDPNQKVGGKGIAILEAAGCDVEVGVLEEKCLEHHKRFICSQVKKRPYVILKWAETKDGFIAPLQKEDKNPVWISNQNSQQLVHRWRMEEHAILVGTNTVVEDNPSLTVRSWSGKNPIRIVLDRTLRLSKKYTVLDGEKKTIVLTERNNQNNTTNLIYENIDFNLPIASQIVTVLQKHQIQSVIIEGGKKTLETFISERIWDEARVFIGNSVFKNGIKSPNINKEYKKKMAILTDELKIYRND